MSTTKRPLNISREDTRRPDKATLCFYAGGALFLIILAGLILYNSGAFQRRAVAITSDGVDYSVSDVAFYYYNTKSNIIDQGAVDGSLPLNEQEYTDSDEFDTWYDYVLHQSTQALVSVKQIAKEASEAGFDGGAEVNERVSTELEQIKSAASANGYSESDYISLVYGKLADKNTVERNIRENFLAETYSNAKFDGTAYTAEDLEAEYAKNPIEYQEAAFEAVIFLDSKFAPQETSPDATVASSTIDATEAAQDALTRYRAGESLKELALEYDCEYSNTTTPHGEGTPFLEWIFHETHEVGDAEVLDYEDATGMETGKMLVVYHGVSRPEYHTVNVRHILVDDEETAHDILSKYLEGEQTEDAFASLATENSRDNPVGGGLYENVYKGQMVKEFEDWCFSPERKAGETGIVKSDFGFHVMYFVGQNPLEFWASQVANAMAQTWYHDVNSEHDIEYREGLRYIVP